MNQLRPFEPPVTGFEMPQQQWWVFANGQKHGPFASEQLRQLANAGKLRPEMQIIATGMQSPVAASRVPGLFDQLPTARSEVQSTPPLVRKPPIVMPHPQVAVVTAVAPSVATPEPKKGAFSPTMVAAWLLVGVLAVSGVAFVIWHSGSRHQAEVAAADAQASRSIANARTWIAGNSQLDVMTVEAALTESIQNQLTTKRSDAEVALNQVRERRQQLAEQALVEAADLVFSRARQHIDANQIQDAIPLLRQYVIDPRATQRNEAQRLLDEAEIAVSETETQRGIAAMTDDQLAIASKSRVPEIPDGKVTDPALKHIRAEMIFRHLPAEARRRDDLKVAAEKRIEAERQAAIARQREAEEMRREADEAKRLQAEREQAAKLAAAQAAARQAAAQQAAKEAESDAKIEEHNDLVKANMIRWAATLSRTERVKFNEPMVDVVMCSKGMSQWTKAELIEAFQNILKRPDLREMEEFIKRSGIGELIVKVKADGKTRSFDDAWTYGISLVLKEGQKGKVGALDQAREDGDESVASSIGLRLMPIPAGKYRVEAGEIEITKSFYLGETEITQEQWTKVMESESFYNGPASTPRELAKKGKNYPAVFVSWLDAIAFCKKLSVKDGKKYRLPTEAEWELACRADEARGERQLDEVAWYFKNAAAKVESRFAHEVAQKKPNKFGLYDIQGNVREWCQDVHVHSRPVGKDPVEPVVKHEGGSSLVTRGGSFMSDVEQCETSWREYNTPSYRSFDLGFRIVLEK